MDTLLTAPTVAITTTFQVSFGQNINNSVGQLEYIGFVSALGVVPIAPIVGGVGGAVLLICVILVLIIIPVVCYHRTKVSKGKQQYQAGSYL